MDVGSRRKGLARRGKWCGHSLSAGRLEGKIVDRGNSSSLAAFLLVNRFQKANAPLTVGEFWKVIKSTDDPAQLMNKSSKEISEVTGAPEDVADLSLIHISEPT